MTTATLEVVEGGRPLEAGSRGLETAMLRREQSTPASTRASTLPPHTAA